MNFNSCNDIFNRLDNQKKEAILSTAIVEFSSQGFNSTNINVIAQKANISVGAMYKYFNSKRALYLTCVELSIMHLNNAIEQVVSSGDGIFIILERIINTIQKDRKQNELYTKLYYEMATEGNAEYAMTISSLVEGVTANLYSAFIKEAQQSQGLRQDIDPRFFAWLIDNLLMMLQFSYSCEYYKDRMKIYTNESVLDDDHHVCEQMMRFIKGALLYSDA